MSAPVEHIQAAADSPHGMFASVFGPGRMTAAGGNGTPETFAELNTEVLKALFGNQPFESCPRPQWLGAWVEVPPDMMPYIERTQAFANLGGLAAHGRSAARANSQVHADFVFNLSEPEPEMQMLIWEPALERFRFEPMGYRLTRQSSSANIARAFCE